MKMLMRVKKKLRLNKLYNQNSPKNKPNLNPKRRKKMK